MIAELKNQVDIAQEYNEKENIQIHFIPSYLHEFTPCFKWGNNDPKQKEADFTQKEADFQKEEIADSVRALNLLV